MKVLLFGGTREGRDLAGWLSEQGMSVTASVATKYGAEMLSALNNITVHTGRLNAGGITKWLERERFDCVVDATHPYAVLATKHIAAAAEAAQIPCLRLVRDGNVTGSWIEAGDMAHAAVLADEIPGNILLTTGSKELNHFAGPALRGRSYPRVLPDITSLERCLTLGFPGANIICMQGPFSRELNAALIHARDIRVLITKASGTAGGFWEKVTASEETGCSLIVIGRPAQETGFTPEEIKRALKTLQGEISLGVQKGG